jgi:hypothetical protein
MPDRHHAFADLKPYVCSSGKVECDLELFADRNSWFTHELQSHRHQWVCFFCKKGPFGSLSQFKTHLRAKHPEVPKEQDSEMTKLCQQPSELISAEACPFCDDFAKKLRASQLTDRAMPQSTEKPESILVPARLFRRHVGSHMEQLALFSLGTQNLPLDTPDNESVISHGAIAAADIDSNAITDLNEAVTACSDPVAAVMTALQTAVAQFLTEFERLDQESGLIPLIRANLGLVADIHLELGRRRGPAGVSEYEVELVRRSTQRWQELANTCNQIEPSSAARETSKDHQYSISSRNSASSARDNTTSSITPDSANAPLPKLDIYPWKTKQLPKEDQGREAQQTDYYTPYQPSDRIGDFAGSTEGHYSTGTPTINRLSLSTGIKRLSWNPWKNKRLLVEAQEREAQRTAELARREIAAKAERRLYEEALRKQHERHKAEIQRQMKVLAKEKRAVAEAQAEKEHERRLWQLQEDNARRAAENERLRPEAGEAERKGVALMQGERELPLIPQLHEIENEHLRLNGVLRAIKDKLGIE